MICIKLLQIVCTSYFLCCKLVTIGFTVSLNKVIYFKPRYMFNIFSECHLSLFTPLFSTIIYLIFPQPLCIIFFDRYDLTLWKLIKLLVNQTAVQSHGFIYFFVYTRGGGAGLHGKFHLPRCVR